MLSRDCEGCSQIKKCSKRYQTATIGEKVYCPNGTAHLVDSDSIQQNKDFYENNYAIIILK